MYGGSRVDQEPYFLGSSLGLLIVGNSQSASERLMDLWTLLHRSGIWLNPQAVQPNIERHPFGSVGSSRRALDRVLGDAAKQQVLLVEVGR